MKEDDMIIVAGTAKLAPGEIERLGEAMARQMAATREEDGCEQYDFSRHLSDPDLLIISERWRDQAAIDAHFATPHMAEFNAALASASVLSLNVVAYEVSGSRQLMGGG
jgi:quinol monooxygenase YgiN